MAYDEGAAALLRDDLIGKGHVREQKMFGGLCFMVNGNMVCGVHKGGAMFRVGKDRAEEAMGIDGAGPMDFTGRRMGGMINVTDEALADDGRRRAWMLMALVHAASLPAK